MFFFFNIVKKKSPFYYRFPQVLMSDRWRQVLQNPTKEHKLLCLSWLVLHRQDKKKKPHVFAPFWASTVLTWTWPASGRGGSGNNASFTANCSRQQHLRDNGRAAQWPENAGTPRLQSTVREGRRQPAASGSAGNLKEPHREPPVQRARLCERSWSGSRWMECPGVRTDWQTTLWIPFGGSTRELDSSIILHTALKTPLQILKVDTRY